MSDIMDKKRKARSDDLVGDAKTQSLTRKVRVVSDDPPLFRGITIEEDKETGRIISLHSRSRLDRDRWQGSNMPSVAIFPDLQLLELFKCRYIENVHDSLSQLTQLRILKIIGCSRLQAIPDSIDRLNQLEEVRKSFWIKTCYREWNFLLNHPFLITNKARLYRFRADTVVTRFYRKFKVVSRAFLLQSTLNTE